MDIYFANTSPEVQQAKMRFGIVGNAPALTAAIARAIQVAPIDLSVLITGESGTGKEFFPKIIHHFSHRKHSTYIAVNCGAIPEGTIDSELFGHEKGAFTGAVAARKGYFEEADGGTIFLDEVAELPMTTQARLLRVLESGEFLKVGSSTVQKANVRIVAATNVDMAQAVARGKFREDLFYRLSTVQITVPPLRDRGNDIALLARKFASEFAERYRTPAITISDQARAELMAYRWPGNVRQLKNVVEQLALFDAGNDITAEDTRAYLPDSTTMPVFTPPSGSGLSSATGLHSYEAEREMLFSMLLGLRREIEELRAQIGEKEHHSVKGAIAPDTSTHLTAEQHISDQQPPQAAALVRYTPIETRIPDNHPVATLTLEQTERDTIRRSLERNGGRRKATARELNISERTLYRKIKEYGLEDI